MNARNLVLAFVLFGIVMVGYRALSPKEQDPHSVQQTDGIRGAPLVSVNVPTLSDAAARGEAAFEANCATCHGINAAGQDGVAPPLVHKIYEPSHHGDASFVLAVKNGVRAHHWRFGNMPAVPGVSDQEIADITVYVRQLQRANGIN